MRIAIDLTSISDNLSGLERYALKLSLALIRSSGPSECFCLLVKNALPASLRELRHNSRVRFVRLRGKNKLIANQLTLPLCLSRIAADAYIFPAFPVPLLFHKKNSYGLIADMGCFDCPQTMSIKQRLFFRAGAVHSKHACRRIFTISEFSRGRIAALLRMPRENIRLAPCAADVPDAAALSAERQRKLREKYSLPNRYYLSLCTLEPRKNLKLLIDAYAELAGAGEELPPLVLAGRLGWMMEDTIAAAVKNERIILPGFIEEEELPALYAGAACFIFPSLYEGFGLPPLEALACGCFKVLCSDAPALREVMGDCAMYFKNNDKVSLKAALRRVASEEPVKRAAAAQRLSRFSWDKSAAVLWEELR